MKEQNYNDEILTQYLLGCLTEDETERLDELSIADDEIAARLQMIENDLVDAYARGHLSGKTLAQFESFYLASPKRREKVGFARPFLVFRERPAGSDDARDAQQTPFRGPSPSSLASSERASRLRFLAIPRPALLWGFAAAALLLLLVGGYLTIENLRLRSQILQTQAERANLEQRELDLRRQLAAQRSSDEETEKELALVRDRLAQLEPTPGQQGAKGEQREPKILAFNLSPQTRGIGQIPTLAVPPGPEYVVLTLELEADDFPAYQAALKNPATGQIIWRSGKVRPVGTAKTLRVRLPASSLRAQNYSVELSGIPANGAPEVVSSYDFRVVTQ